MFVTLFIPPTVDESSAIRGDWTWPYARHLAPIQRGVNVFLLADGTFTQVQPPLNRGVVKEYLGGHEHPVTVAEAAALTAAGYTVTRVGDGLLTESGVPFLTEDRAGVLYLEGG